jgi:hypothetical protein
MKSFCTKTAALMGLVGMLALFLLPLGVLADASATTNTTNYVPLIPVPGAPVNSSGAIDTSNIGGYAAALATVLYSMAGAAAVVGIIYGAFVRATSDAVSGQEKGRELIVRSFLGLIIIFGAYAVLNTINPQLLNFSAVNVASLRLLINNGVIKNNFQNSASPSGVGNAPGQTPTAAQQQSTNAAIQSYSAAQNPNVDCSGGGC